MKLNELLEARYDLKSGEGLSHALDTSEKLAKAIRKNCSDMVKAYRLADGVLYRGMGMDRGRAEDGKAHMEPQPAEFATIRKDRKPVEMRGNQHELLHKAFIDMGLSATRKNGIFCTAERSTAKDWGTSYIIFLRNGWSGTVFENAKDRYAFFDLYYAGEESDSDEDRMKTIKQAIEKLEPVEFSSPRKLSDIIKQKYKDIILTGDSYIALQVGKKQTREVLNILGIDE